MNDAQNKIEELVKEYIRVFPLEYKSVVNIVKQKRENQEDKFAKVKNTEVLDRALFEIPETLYNVFSLNLAKDEMKYYKSKIGSRWFVNRFREFSLAEKI